MSFGICGNAIPPYVLNLEEEEEEEEKEEKEEKEEMILK